MRYEWDEEKNRANLAKHGVGFEAVVRFEWATAVIEIDSREDYGELREIAFGFIADRLHVLVFVERGTDRRRLISLRRATNGEKRRYVEHRR